VLFGAAVAVLLTKWRRKPLKTFKAAQASGITNFREVYRFTEATQVGQG
jgi:hypothetical protein